uniref:Uncharacterized protein n=1 Tax=Rhizophora mucronata TaxID=61149 RepID=A0A2P2QXL1_RHIMU
MSHIIREILKITYNNVFIFIL